MATALNQHSINKRASDYVVRLYSGELTAKEESEILAWCDGQKPPIKQLLTMRF